MTTTALTAQKETENLSNNGATVGVDSEIKIAVHELVGIEKRHLIPNGRKNCHCLQSGMKRGNIILLTRTEEGQEWIICLPSKKRSVLFPLTYLTFYGIGENQDGNEVAVRAETIQARGHTNLKELLLSIKDPEIKLEEIVNQETGEVSAFYIN